ncbi:MAG TPA: DUF1580 domain-containing protein [Isosphaeraceae bacterium]|nr:DUF1580 domain-containing protein [Isosphaeraceae bacterium]
MTHGPAASGRLRILQEDRVDIDEACVILGTAARPAHPSTVRRAMKRGDLEFLRVGGRLITSIQAIERYVARTNGIDAESPAAEVRGHAPSAQRERDLARTDAELKAAGI